MRLTTEELERVNRAVGAAEAHTSGEIVCIVAEEASSYPEVPLALGAGLALTTPALLLLFGLGPWTADWRIAHDAASDAALVTVAAILLTVQALLFLLGWLLGSTPAVRRMLTPRGLKRERVRQRALEQFLSKNLHRTDARTGVLIFVSIKDRMAELLADEGIIAKLEPHVWDEAMAALVAGMRRKALAEGLEAAVQRCGEVLARRFPRAVDDRNELPNAVLVLPRL